MLGYDDIRCMVHLFFFSFLFLILESINFSFFLSFFLFNFHIRDDPVVATSTFLQSLRARIFGTPRLATDSSSAREKAKVFKW